MIKIDYDATFSPEEIDIIYHEIELEFKQVRERYKGLVARVWGKMKDKDQKTLAECVDSLHPLTEMAQGEQKEDLIRLTYGIIDYMARFRNTSVERLL